MEDKFKLSILTTEKSWYIMSLVEDLLSEQPGIEIILFIRSGNNHLQSISRNSKEMGLVWVVKKMIKRCVQWLKFLKYRSRIAIINIDSYDEILRIKDLDLLIVYNTGILGPLIFNHPKNGTICAHPAMLPLGRGVAGSDKAILNNDPVGVTVFQLDQGIDTGKIYCQKEINKGNLYSFDQLKCEVSKLSLDLTVKSVSLVRSGVLPKRQKSTFPYVKLASSDRMVARQKWRDLFKVNKMNGLPVFKQKVKSQFLSNSSDLYWGDDADCRFWILKKFHQIKNKTLLDIGCQAGNTLGLLDPSNQLYGIDINQEYIDRAKDQNPTCQLDQGSMLDLPYKNNMFDVVFMLNVMPGWDFEGGDCKSREIALKEADRVLKCNGLLVITTPNGESIYYKSNEKGTIFSLLPLLKKFSIEIYGWNDISKYIFAIPFPVFANYIARIFSYREFFWNYLQVNMTFNRRHSKSIIIFARKNKSCKL